MPETRVERAVFVLGLAAIAALGFLVAHLWHNRQAVQAASATTSVAAPQRATTEMIATTTKTEATRETRTTPASAAGLVSLRLTARSGTWLEVRSSTATGSVLYAGTLPAGSSKAFHARALWARFGAAGNLSARLGGKPLLLPSGTYTAMFDKHGWRRLGG
jgi:Domain of unknown function (DUF4115)